jgi:glycosyltransferase involved in cell wall biosynthesis
MCKKKVLVVYATDYATISPGGIRTYIEVLAKTPPEEIQVSYLGVTSEHAPSIGSKLFIGLPLRTPFNRLNLGFLFSLLRYDFSNYDLIVCHRAEAALLLSIVHRKRTFLTLHGGTFNALRSNHRFFGLIYPFIEFMAVLFSSRTQAVNIDTINALTRFVGKVEQAPLIMNTSDFYPGQKLGNSIFLVGRLAPEKRFSMALRVISGVSEQLGRKLEIDIIGDGPLRRELQELSSTLGLQPRIHGYLENADVAELLRERGKVLLITSRFEGLPIVALEALLCGVNVFALRGPGVGGNLASFGALIFENTQELSRSLIGLFTKENSSTLQVERLWQEVKYGTSKYWQAVLNSME